MDGAKFRELLYEELAQEFTAVDRIRRFTTNSAIIGAHAEVAVRAFVNRTVHPMRVSTGAVIHDSLCDGDSKTPQNDTIIWAPNPHPAIFDNGDFALVPKQCSFGILEIKTSIYDSGIQKAQEVIARNSELTQDATEMEWAGESVASGLAVYCLQLQEQTISSSLQNDIDNNRAVVLCKMTDDGVDTNLNSMIKFVNFLSAIRTWGLGSAGTSKVREAEVGESRRPL